MKALPALLAACCFFVYGESFSPADVAILGDIDYGARSAELECAAKPQYCALVFNGTSGDRVEVTVTGTPAQTTVAIADGSLKELARGTGSATVTLPKVAEDLATYYILFRDPAGKPGKFTVELKKK
jgi:hypothetical protein